MGEKERAMARSSGRKSFVVAVGGVGVPHGAARAATATKEQPPRRKNKGNNLQEEEWLVCKMMTPRMGSSRRS